MSITRQLAGRQFKMNEKDASILNADTTERLLQLYQKASKHSNYQVPAKILLPFIPVEKLNIARVMSGKEWTTLRPD